MLKDIVKIANKLDFLGLTKEADVLDSFIFKILKKGMPLEGFVPIHKNEPTGYGTEEDEDGNIIENPIEMVNRDPYIKRDQHTRRDYSSAEQQKAELDEWYSQLKELGDSIILIPFDRTDIDSNPEILDGLCDIFKIRRSDISLTDREIAENKEREEKAIKLKIKIEPLTTEYIKLKNKVTLTYNPQKDGDLETLKTRFPSLWYDISKILNEKGIDESDAVYMLYNQQTNPGRLETFKKDPFYFAHDIGHTVFDGGDDPEFRGLVDDFMQDILSLYTLDIDPDDEDLQEFSGKNAYQAIVGDNEYDYEQEDKMQKYLPYFFDTTSDVGDLYGDVFAATTGGYLEFYFPQELYIYTESGHNLRTTLSDVGSANAVASATIRKMKYYVNPGNEKETFKSGPLGSFKGSVVLQDI
jgi:hypothetical protein